MYCGGGARRQSAPRPSAGNGVQTVGSKTARRERVPLSACRIAIAGNSDRDRPRSVIAMPWDPRSRSAGTRKQRHDERGVMHKADRVIESMHFVRIVSQFIIRQA